MGGCLLDDDGVGRKQLGEGRHHCFWTHARRHGRFAGGRAAGGVTRASPMGASLSSSASITGPTEPTMVSPTCAKTACRGSSTICTIVVFAAIGGPLEGT